MIYVLTTTCGEIINKKDCNSLAVAENYFAKVKKFSVSQLLEIYIVRKK